MGREDLLNCCKGWTNFSKLPSMSINADDFKKKFRTYAGPFSGSLIDPTNDSWFCLNRYPITLRITTANAESTVQNHAFPDYFNWIG